MRFTVGNAHGALRDVQLSFSWSCCQMSETPISKRYYDEKNSVEFHTLFYKYLFSRLIVSYVKIFGIKQTDQYMEG